MKIAISAANPTMDAEIDPRFGRCQYFIIADSETMEFEAVNNDNAAAAGGAGIATAQMIVEKGAGVVLTGNCGPNAHGVLSAANIEIITGVSGKIKDAIEGYKAGAYQAVQQANVPDHYGAGGGTGTGVTPGTGRGMGGGRGMGTGGGRGMGKGMGKGRGMGMGMPASVNNPASQSPEQEIQSLKAQSQAIAQQLTDIQHRIDELEKKQG
jgi:predicted Fe-Mo cluster-binding NifX family protein